MRLAARGHRVTIVDHAPTMLAAATERAVAEGVTELITCVEADATDLLSPLRAGGLVSVMAISRHSAPLNIAVREMDPAAALAADQARTQMFNSALTLHTADEIIPTLRKLGCRDIAHYGIRSFCDYITDDARKHEPDFYADLERLELATTARPPYMHTHVSVLIGYAASDGSVARRRRTTGELTVENILSVAIGAAIGLIGVLFGSWFTARRQDRSLGKPVRFRHRKSTLDLR
ncbi:hypothetical protein PUR53_20380 [Streptomyces sp. SP18BB07]|nr:hypothetical protein [Streptomyces sp. SP18BB07]